VADPVKRLSCREVPHSQAKMAPDTLSTASVPAFESTGARQLD
jgi:hypothetical protein